MTGDPRQRRLATRLVHLHADHADANGSARRVLSARLDEACDVAAILDIAPTGATLRLIVNDAMDYIGPRPPVTMSGAERRLWTTAAVDALLTHLTHGIGW
ncbi:hypothetical protein HUW46_09230 [Amycolatopsis sp. CA-230715]|nr:hypothetical protein HUW46_09230 [Amycolatopsis sp. CA-230715]